jgi:hypothetical protein
MSDVERGILGEYVKVAEQLLKEYGDAYTPDSLEKLSMVLIERDRISAMEKEAEDIIYHSFAEELQNLGVDPIPVLKEMVKTDEA